MHIRKRHHILGFGKCLCIWQRLPGNMLVVEHSTCTQGGAVLPPSPPPPPHRKRQCPPSLQQAPRLRGPFTLPRCFCSPLRASTPGVLRRRRDTGYAGCPGGLVRDLGLRSHLSLTGQYLQPYTETLTLRNISVCQWLQTMARGLNRVTSGFCMVHKLRMGFMFLNGWCSRLKACVAPQIHMWKHISRCGGIWW